MKTTLKLLTTSVVFTLVTIFTASAQYRFGVAAGANFSNVIGDESSDNGIKLGLHAGLDMEAAINDRYAITAAVLYAVKGTKSNEMDDLSVAINYIEVPLAIKYQFKNGFGLWLGPYFGILTNAKLKYQDETEDVTSSFNDLDAGVKVGVGYRMENGMGVYANYSMGLTNIDHFDNADMENQNSVFGVGLSYFIFN